MDDEDRIRKYMASVRGKFARTMPECPHTHTFHSWEPALCPEFLWFVRYLRDRGAVEPRRNCRHARYTPRVGKEVVPDRSLDLRNHFHAMAYSAKFNIKSHSASSASPRTPYSVCSNVRWMKSAVPTRPHTTQGVCEHVLRLTDFRLLSTADGYRYEGWHLQWGQGRIRGMRGKGLVEKLRRDAPGRRAVQISCFPREGFRRRVGRSRPSAGAVAVTPPRGAARCVDRPGGGRWER